MILRIREEKEEEEEEGEEEEKEEEEEEEEEKEEEEKLGKPPDEELFEIIPNVWRLLGTFYHFAGNDSFNFFPF